jgi:hypothetical protein
MVRRWLDFLTLRLGRDGFAELSWRRYLVPGLIATWLVGIGRYWDHPQAHWLQHLGLGSVVYVFVLGAILWAVVTPLKPQRWAYLDVVTVISLTSPPAILYAIPVERWTSLETAADVNAWFLTAVAAWRVALLVFCLRRLADLTWPRTIVSALLPLSAIVTILTILNLEQAVFQVMAGIHEPTANDDAYLILVLLTFLSAYAAVVLVPAYLYLVVKIRWLEPRRQRRLAYWDNS